MIISSVRHMGLQWLIEDDNPRFLPLDSFKGFATY
jgi:hypothetical protein